MKHVILSHLYSLQALNGHCLFFMRGTSKAITTANISQVCRVGAYFVEMLTLTMYCLSVS